MRQEHISLLQCLECRGALDLSESIPSITFPGFPSEIKEGVLVCRECGAAYPIIEGAGLFFKRNVFPHMLSSYEKDVCERLGLTTIRPAPVGQGGEKVVRVAENWSYQWNEIYNLDTPGLTNDPFLSEKAFFDFIRIERGYIRDSTVVVWCGGFGREAHHLAKYSPALIVVVDLGDEIYRVRAAVGGKVPVLALRCDITAHPLKNKIADISICDHALQHVSDHRLGFRHIAGICRPGGKVAINVYSRENNILMTHGVEPMKRLLHYLPLGALRYLSLIPALGVWLVIHMLYVPASHMLPGTVARRLFLFDHMMFWAPSSFRFIWCACFDLVHAPISYHFRKEELLLLAAENGLQVETVANTNGTTWSLVAAR